MAERIIPTTYGRWWARYPGEYEYSIVPIVWMQHGLYALCEKSKGVRDPRDMDIEWIAPVEMPEAVAKLRKHIADLQSGYDHVVKCEQNRCRETVELQDKISNAPLAYCSCETEEEEKYTIILGRIEGHHTKVRLVHE